jgi:hypothetical protein
MEQMGRSPLGTGGGGFGSSAMGGAREARKRTGRNTGEGFVGGRGARVMRPPLPRSGGGEGSTCREEAALAGGGGTGHAAAIAAVGGGGEGSPCREEAARRRLARRVLVHRRA